MFGETHFLCYSLFLFVSGQAISQTFYNKDPAGGAPGIASANMGVFYPRAEGCLEDSASF